MTRPTSYIDLGHVLDHAKAMVGDQWSPEIEREVRRAARSHAKQLCRYSVAGGSGRVSQCRHLEYRLTRSPASWLVHLILGRRKTTAASWDALTDLAHKLTKTRGVSTRSVRAISLMKPDGGERTVLSFHWEARAGQSLMASIVKARAGESDYEYVRKGRGREAAAGRTLHAINHKGVRCFVLADVKSFFPSCSRAMAEGVLPIRKALLHRFAFLRDDITIKANHIAETHTFEQAVRSGLPEGSMCSGIIASKIMEGVLDKIEAPLALCHGDNILIGCKSEADAHAKQTALASACEKHPNGPLLLKESVVAPLGAPMDFCGYRFKRQGARDGGHGKAIPSESAFGRLDRRVFQRLLLVLESKQSHVIDKHTGRWAFSFRHWKGRADGARLAAICIESEIVPVVWRAQRLAKKLSFPSFSELHGHLLAATSSLTAHSYQAGGLQRPPPITSQNAIFDADRAHRFANPITGL